MSVNYKERIRDCLKQLGESGIDVKPLEEQLAQVPSSNQHQLFLMYQTLREVLTKETTGVAEAPFMYSDKRGNVKTVKSLKEI